MPPLTTKGPLQATVENITGQSLTPLLPAVEGKRYHIHHLSIVNMVTSGDGTRVDVRIESTLADCVYIGAPGEANRSYGRDATLRTGISEGLQLQSTANSQSIVASALYTVHNV